MSFKNLSKKTGIPESDINDLWSSLSKMKADVLFDTPESKEFVRLDKNYTVNLHIIGVLVMF